MRTLEDMEDRLDEVVERAYPDNPELVAAAMAALVGIDRARLLQQINETLANIAAELSRIKALRQ